MAAARYDYTVCGQHVQILHGCERGKEEGGNVGEEKWLMKACLDKEYVPCPHWRAIRKGKANRMICGKAKKRETNSDELKEYMLHFLKCCHSFLARATADNRILYVKENIGRPDVVA